MKAVVKTPKEMALLARRMSRVFHPSAGWATVLALEGTLGAGKTTFTQGLARAMGVREKIQSPTFVLLKMYDLPKAKNGFFRFLHLDLYRLNTIRDLKPLRLKELFHDEHALVVIEWPERARGAIPKRAHWISFKHGPGKARTVLY
jgi:tRNA threonylcarbamoyladenosine biosynthesis protein TsaE